MSVGHQGHQAAHVVKMVSNLPALEQEKNPVVAGLLGFFFGAVGVGLYFKSWSDFFVCIFALVFLTFVIPGLGAFPGWWFAAAYGAFRAVSSNRKLGA